MTSSKTRIVPVRSQRRAHRLEIARPRRDRAGVAHRGLHDHGRDVAALEPRHQGLRVVPGHDFGVRPGQLVLTPADRDPSRPIGRSALLGGRRETPQDVVHPAVVMALELDHDVPAGRRAGEPQRDLHDLRSGRAEAHPLGAGHEFAEQPGRLELDLCLAGEQDAVAQLALDRCDYRRRVVAQDDRAHGEVVVDQAVAVDVDQVGPFAPGEHQPRGRDPCAELAVDPACEIPLRVRHRLARAREVTDRHPRSSLRAGANTMPDDRKHLRCGSTHRPYRSTSPRMGHPSTAAMGFMSGHHRRYFRSLLFDPEAVVQRRIASFRSSACRPDARNARPASRGPRSGSFVPAPAARAAHAILGASTTPGQLRCRPMTCQMHELARLPILPGLAREGVADIGGQALLKLESSIAKMEAAGDDDPKLRVALDYLRREGWAERGWIPCRTALRSASLVAHGQRPVGLDVLVDHFRKSPCPPFRSR